MSTTPSTQRKTKARNKIKSFLRRKTIHKRNHALINYVTNQESNANATAIIEAFCRKSPPKTITLYRGHKNTKNIRKSSWYSATKSKSVAKHEFSGENCCVFTIHVINVPIIDINQHVKSKIGTYAEEDEFIILGGGTFYKNKSLTEPGFDDLGNGEYECWYTMNKSIEKLSIRRAMAQISTEEYEDIDSPSDIFVPGITDAQRNMIFDEIMKIKTKN